MPDPREVLTRPGPPPDVTMSYGSSPEQVVEFRLPPGADGLVVLFHGGFWRAEFDRIHLRPMAAALAEAGYAVALPEFRRVGSPGGGWPGTFDDLAAAIDSLPGLPGLLGERGISPDAAVWVGHSAGGHLAMWGAARRRLPIGSGWYGTAVPRAIVSLAGCSVLALCSAWRLGDGAADELVGGPPGEVPERYVLADPAALLPLDVPVTLVHGVDDDRVPVAMSHQYAARAARTGDTVLMRELPGVEHFALIDPLSAAWPVVLDAIQEAMSA